MSNQTDNVVLKMNTGEHRSQIPNRGFSFPFSEWRFLHKILEGNSPNSPHDATIWMSFEPDTVSEHMGTIALRVSYQSPWKEQGNTWTSSESFFHKCDGLLKTL
jgi:hypothetical protein